MDGGISLAICDARRWASGEMQSHTDEEVHQSHFSSVSFRSDTTKFPIPYYHLKNQ